MRHRFTLLMYGLAELAGDLIFGAVSVVGGADGMIPDPSYHKYTSAEEEKA